VWPDLLPRTLLDAEKNPRHDSVTFPHSMPRRILGISAYYHDSAAALVVDGTIIAAAQEERFTRIKHDADFPARAVDYCLREGRLEPGEIDYVVFYDKPLLKFDRLLETYVAYAPAGLFSFMRAMPLWLKRKLFLPRQIKGALGGAYRKRVAFTSHHESHAACAFFPSPFEEAAILTLDGVGEWDTASIGIGKGNQIDLLKTLHFPHSLGLLYSAFTYHCGFKVNSGEYKLMGLAPYGRPIYAEIIRERLLDLKADGSFRLDMRYFNYAQGLTMTAAEFDRLFGGGPRKTEGAITQREMDLAASIQKVTEEIILRMARHVREITGLKHLCLAGGVALNCVANGVLLRERIFDDIWIPPAAGDAGGALGAALFVSHQLLGAPRIPGATDALNGAQLGPKFSDAEVRAFLDGTKMKYQHYQDEAALLAEVAGAIAGGKVVGWFQDRMEFGPRALGARSILGDARNPAMQAQMNIRIKFRESFRPFAPSCLAEDAAKWFELDRESPYMLLVARVREDSRTPLTRGQRALQRDPDLRKRVNVPRSALPAITHVDYSARIQTVSELRNRRYYRLLREFKRQTGCGVIANTSFNIRGEPIVCTPEDACRCFMACDMDVLVLENCVLWKEDQPAVSAAERKRYVDSFRPD
jgi:carbamoyltransferase